MDRKAKIKELMEERRFITAEELINDATTNAIEAMRSPDFDLHKETGGDQPTFDEFRRRLSAYEQAVDEIAAVLGAVAYYGGEDLHVAMRRSLERIGDEMNDLDKKGTSGKPLWNGLRVYPALLTFHFVCCAAIAADRWENLRPLIRYGRLAERQLEEARVPMLARLAPTSPFKEQVDQWFVSEGPRIEPKHHTPLEDRLCDRIANWLVQLGIEQNEAERVFDCWLFVAQITFQGISENGGGRGAYFTAGRWWRISDWNRSPQAEIVERVRYEGNECRVLRSGAAPDAEQFLALATEAREMIVRVAGRRGF